MKCVKDGCRGFLSQAYKCELCNTYVCKECMAVKKERDDDTHTCKKEDIDTVALIRKETKPCPKCGIRISKIDGCDQMWCTAEGCGTAFSWISGKVISGTIHNPHYYEWLRRNNNGAIPRNPGDVPCGGLPQIYDISRNLRNLGIVTYTALGQNATKITKEANVIMLAHASLTDLEYVRVPQYNVQRDANMLKEHHVDFLLNTVTEEKWKQSIYMKELNLEKRQLIGQIIQTFYNAGADLMRSIATNIVALVQKKAHNIRYTVNDDDWKPISDNVSQLENLRNYINESLEKLAETASVAVPQFSTVWYWQGVASAERIRATREAELAKASKPTATTTT